MIIKVNANLSGAVTAKKNQEITVSRQQGAALIDRGLAVEVKAARVNKSEQPDEKESRDDDAQA